MSATFSAKCGSFDSFKVSCRCGLETMLAPQVCYKHVGHLDAFMPLQVFRHLPA